MLGFRSLGLTRRRRGISLADFLATEPLLYTAEFSPSRGKFFDVREADTENPVLPYLIPTQARCAQVEVGDTITLPNYTYTSWTHGGTCAFTVSGTTLAVTAPGTLYDLQLVHGGRSTVFPVCEGGGDKLFGYALWSMSASVDTADTTRFWSGRQNEYFHGIKHGQTVGVQNHCRQSTLEGGVMSWGANSDPVYEGDGVWSISLDSRDNYSAYGWSLDSFFTHEPDEVYFFSIDLKAAQGTSGYIFIDDSPGWSRSTNALQFVTDTWQRFTVKRTGISTSEIPRSHGISLRYSRHQGPVVPRLSFRRPQIHSVEHARYSITVNPINVGLPDSQLVNIAANLTNVGFDCIGNALTDQPGVNHTALYAFDPSLSPVLGAPYFDAMGQPIARSYGDIAADTSGKVFLGKRGMAVYASAQAEKQVKIIKSFLGA